MLLCFFIGDSFLQKSFVLDKKMMANLLIMVSQAGEMRKIQVNIYLCQRKRYRYVAQDSLPYFYRSFTDVLFMPERKQV